MNFSIAKFDCEIIINPRPERNALENPIIQSARTYSERNIKIQRRSGANVLKGRKLGPMNARSKAILKMVDEDA